MKEPKVGQIRIWKDSRATVIYRIISIDQYHAEIKILKNDSKRNYWEIGHICTFNLEDDVLIDELATPLYQALHGLD